jgi:phage shock protein PspC (stress-responsive transcriptional regulator)
LYRNPDDKVIAGVASGLAAYFHIEVWIPRLIFCLPLVLTIISAIVHAAWFDWGDPGFYTGSFSGTLFITYIVLWIVLPEAITASEKLEMRGEKVDLESIKNTIKNDLGNFSKKAKDASAEMRESFQRAGEQVRRGTQNFAMEAGPAIRKTHSGFAHAIGMLFKIFFLFIAGVIAFALIMALIAIAFRGEGLITVKNFILQGVGQNFLAWTGFVLFLVIPVVALLTWLVRRITGTRSRNHYLGYAFATLWVIGLICVIVLIGIVMRNFTSRQHVEENITLSSPSHGKLILRAEGNRPGTYEGDYWFDWNWQDGPFDMISEDSALLNTVRVNLLKSTDSSYHVQIVKFSHGNGGAVAKQLAQEIDFPVHQVDSELVLPTGFAISTKQKFRNQQVLVNVYIPVGKKIYVHNSVDDYDWFNISTRNRHIRWNKHNDNWDGDWDSDWDNSDSRHWSTNVEYTMTNDGLISNELKRVQKEIQKEIDGDQKKEDKGDEDENPGYRYKAPGVKKGDSVDVKRSASLHQGLETHTYLLNALVTM